VATKAVRARRDITIFHPSLHGWAMFGHITRISIRRQPLVIAHGGAASPPATRLAAPAVSGPFVPALLPSS
jgi:hypothetical protein